MYVCVCLNFFIQLLCTIENFHQYVVQKNLSINFCERKIDTLLIYENINWREIKILERHEFFVWWQGRTLNFNTSISSHSINLYEFKLKNKSKYQISAMLAETFKWKITIYNIYVIDWLITNLKFLNNMWSSHSTNFVTT